MCPQIGIMTKLEYLLIDPFVDFYLVHSQQILCLETKPTRAHFDPRFIKQDVRHEMETVNVELEYETMTQQTKQTCFVIYLTKFDVGTGIII